MTAPRLSLADVQAARAVLEPHLPRTPLRRSFASPEREVWLKLECWQPTGSFKVRGALNAMATLPPGAERRGVVAASAGNHALGVAFAAGILGGRVTATLFVPESAPAAKREKLASFPVRLVVAGRDYDEAHALATAHAERTGAVYVHAYADRATAAGQGTIAIELVEQLPSLAAVVVPVGGGGLLAGIAAALHELRPEARVVAVQPAASPALRESLRLGRPLLEYAAGPTLADALAGGIGEIAWAHRDLVDDVVEVDEEAIGAAMLDLLARDQVVAEAAGAAALAAARTMRAGGGGPVVAVVTGANVDVSVLARLLARR